MALLIPFRRDPMTEREKITTVQQQMPAPCSHSSIWDDRHGSFKLSKQYEREGKNATEEVRENERENKWVALLGSPLKCEDWDVIEIQN